MEYAPSQSPPVDVNPDIRPKLNNRLRKASVAALLSLLFPGLGQLYNRQSRKGLAMAVSSPIITIVVGETRMLFSFWSLVVSLFVMIGWRLWIVSEAARVGWMGGKSPDRFKKPRLVIPIIVILIVLCGVFPTSAQFRNHFSDWGAFKVPSGSMCPTICAGERLVADMNAYRLKSPQRGDLVLLMLPETPALLTKRVIGIAGDKIEAGPKNEVVVNGDALKPPGICGSPALSQVSTGELPNFASTTVPEGSFFVVGDNLANSNDSRYAAFGLVSADQLRGKPLFLYWSPIRSRLGCRTQ